MPGTWLCTRGVFLLDVLRFLPSRTVRSWGSSRCSVQQVTLEGALALAVFKVVSSPSLEATKHAMMIRFPRSKTQFWPYEFHNRR